MNFIPTNMYERITAEYKCYIAEKGYKESQDLSDSIRKLLSSY